MKTSKEILDIISEKFTMEEFAYNDFVYPDEFIQECKDRFELLGMNLDALEDEGLEEYEDLKTAIKTMNYTELYLNSLGLGKIVEVDQEGGEGEGDYWHSVKHFVDHDIYIKISGHYTSYDGTDFYDFGVEVKPKTKIITVYE